MNPEDLFKPTPLTMDELFHKYLPETLYSSHYELAHKFGYTPQEWRTYMRDNHMFIETELAAIAEAEARSALSKLGSASGQEVGALKALLDRSKLINDAQRQNTKVVMTFIPSSEAQITPPTPKTREVLKKEYILEQEDEKPW